MSSNLFNLIYSVVRGIPVGKVMTYGQIARIVNETRRKQNPLIKRVTPQLVGWALHANKFSETPCHRVVNKDGRIAPNYAFDGAREQKRRLEAEGIEFVDEMHVNLGKFWFGEAGS